MRVTHGEKKRRYVYEMRLGEQRVARVYHGQQMIFPTLKDTLAGCVLDVVATENTLAGAFFEHALQAVTAGASEGCHLLMDAGGRTFSLGAEYGRYPVAGYDGHGGVSFGEAGPLASALRVGDEVTLRLTVPARESESFKSPGQNVGFSETWAARWLPGTTMVYSHYKGQKKVCSWASGEVRGRQSGKVYIAALWHNHPGHGRWSNTHAVSEVPGLVPDYADAAFDVSMQVGGSSGIVYCKLLFPAFSETLKMRVIATTRHHD